MESVGAIELINITNDNIDASLIMVDNNGKQVPVVKVVPKKSGETMLTVVDEENNPWIVKVIVGDVGGGGDNGNGDDEITDEEVQQIDSDIENIINEILGTSIQKFNNVSLNAIGLSVELKIRLDSLLNRYNKVKLKKLRTKLYEYDIQTQYADKSESIRNVLEELVNYLLIGVNERLELNIINHQFTSEVDDGYLGGIYFETTGDIKEVGIEYSYLGGNISGIQTIPVNTDNKYGFVFNPQCEESCAIILKPYLIQKSTNYKYMLGNSVMSYGPKLLNYVDPKNQPIIIASTEEGLGVAAIPFVVVGFAWLGVTTIAATCTGDTIDSDCALSLIPMQVLKVGSLIPDSLKNKTLEGVLYLNNKTNLDVYINKFAIAVKENILKNLEEKWLLGVNIIKYNWFKNTNPNYNDFKSTKVAFIGWKSSRIDTTNLDVFKADEMSYNRDILNWPNLKYNFGNIANKTVLIDGNLTSLAKPGGGFWQGNYKDDTDKAIAIFKALKKEDSKAELMYVLKQDGTLFLQPRPGTVPVGEAANFYKFAHIGLVRGPKGTDGKYTVEDVHASGLIKTDTENPEVLQVTNKSGHYLIPWENGSDVAQEKVKDKIASLGYTIDNHEFYQK